MKNLPENYLNRMRKLLGKEFDSFLSSYDLPARRGIRFNMKKARKETVDRLVSEWKLRPVPWCSTGYYYEDVRPGLSPYHDAGVFYMQEPSAMCVAEEADIADSDLVLDLCAAPGGKSTALAERCRVLLSNEIIPGRAKILSSNIERMGFTNTVVTSAEPGQLSDCLSGFFDAVIVDAPCSGEGMMRRDEIAVTEWSEENVALCAERQKMILSEAEKMVRPGGKLVYSTCTFEPGENEEQIRDFLSRKPEFRLVSMKRLWPHLQEGEGHFCAVLIKDGNGTPGQLHTERRTGPLPDVEKAIAYLVKILSAGHIHILRSGLMKGQTFSDKKGKQVYEPSHSEIMASGFGTCENGVNLHSEKLAFAFLHGDVLRPEEPEADFKGTDGFCGVYYDGYPLGPGKRIGSLVKNHLPKGLRHV